ncbi:myeloid leukemia factor isoform X10 [Drosophila guanche]|uniref:Blast:Myeloid leukemia factor n=1 Tax=Drosophila guanche TaxID=7266 RepID=A0A3B0J2J3_DROGU|nr:myeloid leukemia factor isoform X10 [Drosophila guanche]SPP73283.1 blast:Myeloid leukemia factor [Drosophila guanche]
MSLFSALGLMGDFDDDLGLMNNHMNHTMNAMGMQMRSMNRLMNTFMPDPFMQVSPFDPGFQQSALMERPHQMAAMPAMGMFGMPMMPNFNRLLNADIGANPGASFCQSTVMTMSSGPDGRPQIYQASTSTKTGPGGVRETRKTVQDSRTGVKKMAIGHHIGERAHIIEKEQDMRSGQLEERQEFINLDEEEAEQFDREFTTRAHRGGGPHGRHGGMQAIRAPPPAASTSTLTIEPLDDDDDDDDCVIQEQQPQGRSSAGRQLPALPTPPTAPHGSRNATAAAATTTTSSSPAVHDPSNNNYVSIGNSRRAYMRNGQHLATPRRPLRTPASSPLATISSGSHSIAATPSIHPHPYAAHPRRQQRPMKNSHQQQHATEDGGEATSSKSGKRVKK